MMVTAGRRPLVARDPVAGVDPLHEPKLGQGLERPIDGGDPDRAPRPPEPVVDVLGAQAAVLAPEQLDDRRARATTAIPRGSKRLARVRRPAHTTSVSFGPMISRIVLI